MDTSSKSIILNFLDIILVLVALGIVTIVGLNLNPYLEFILLIVIIGYISTRWYYLIKNKGK